MRSLKQINAMIAKEVEGLTMYKGAGYFYFDSAIGFVPDSIMVRHVNDISVADIESAIEKFKKEKAFEAEDREVALNGVIKLGRRY